MKNFLWVAVVATSLLVGCAVPVPLEFHVENPTKAAKRVNAEVRAVTVKTAPKNQQLKEINWFQVENTVGDQFLITSTGTGIPITRQWESALKDALDQSLIFKDDAGRKVSLIVAIKKVEMSGLATVDYDVVAEYKIVDRETGDDLYKKDIASQGSAKTSEAFVGAVRARLALVRAIRGNIQLFIDELKTLSTEDLSS